MVTPIAPVALSPGSRWEENDISPWRAAEMPAELPLMVGGNPPVSAREPAALPPAAQREAVAL